MQHTDIANILLVQNSMTNVKLPGSQPQHTTIANTLLAYNISYFVLPG